MKKGDVLHSIRDEIELRTKRAKTLSGEELEINNIEIDSLKEARSMIWSCSKEKAAQLLMDKTENLRVELDAKNPDPKKGVALIIYKNIYFMIKGR
jgi:hypothetical protein